MSAGIDHVLGGFYENRLFELNMSPVAWHYLSELQQGISLYLVDSSSFQMKAWKQLHGGASAPSAKTSPEW